MVDETNDIFRMILLYFKIFLLSHLFLMEANHATIVRMRLMIHMTTTTGKQALSRENWGSRTLLGRERETNTVAVMPTLEPRVS